MFDTTFSQQPIKGNKHYDIPPFSIKRCASLIWEEHCVECAPPYCYHNCTLYKARKDSRCIRMENGLQKDFRYSGALNYALRCEFRKWAKLEAVYSGRSISISTNKIYHIINNLLSKSFFLLAMLLNKIFTRYQPHSWFIKQRLKWHTKHTTKVSWIPNIFYIKCRLENKKRVDLLIQMDDKNEIRYSQIFKLKEGENELIIPVNNIFRTKDSNNIRIFLTPLDESNTIISFSWLNLLNVTIPTKIPTDKKIKLVAWDLDNTLWEGTLIESEDVKLNEVAVKTIKELDRRGILNVILSKNDYDHAIQKLKELGIYDYFVSFGINWGQKSENLKNIAQRLNLGINSFAFIDDNIRERNDMNAALPEVHIYSEKQINNLLDLPEFEVPITEESSRRRQSYLNEANREKYHAQFNDNYDSFLKGLQMVLRIEYLTDITYERGYELLSRSNQLNLSTNRYTNDEYKKLTSDKNNLCFVFRCQDKFGDYGIISFMSIRINDNQAQIIDFVISCRIAKKKVENAIMYAIKSLLQKKGITRLNAHLIITNKNKPIIDVFNELPFKKKNITDKSIDYYSENLNDIINDNIIQIIYPNNKSL